MKTLTRIFAPLAVLGALASCQMYEIDTQMTPEKAAASIRMECSAVDSYSLPAQNPDNISFNVSSNTPWTLTLSSGAEWLSVTPASSAAGALISDVTVTAQPNTEAEDRSATLTLKGENIATAKVITIKQSRAGKLFVTPMVKDYAAAGGPLTFTIQTNLPWEVHSSEAWISFNRESGDPDPAGRTMTITATAAASDVLERTATITVKAGDDEESFDVAQKGVFQVAELSTPFATTGGSQTFSIRTDLPWTIMADKEWISFDETSGTGDGKPKVITATVTANDGAMRKTNVTVSVGGVDKVFEVSQKGFDFEIVAPASTVLATQGEDVVLTVNTTIDWTPSTDVPGWSVEKIDATSFKLKTTFNDKFVAKTGKVTISGAGSAKDELEFTQDVNFTFKGNYEILEDGSVKIFEDVSSGVFTKQDYRYAIMDADVEMHLGEKGKFFMGTEHYSDGYEYELQFNFTRTDAFRLRYAGDKLGGSSSVEFTFDTTKANAMTHAQICFVPDTDPANINLSFYCDGVIQDKTLVAKSVFAEDATLAGNYSITSLDTADDGSYFIIKSCTVTPVE